MSAPVCALRRHPLTLQQAPTPTPTRHSPKATHLVRLPQRLELGLGARVAPRLVGVDAARQEVVLALDGLGGRVARDLGARVVCAWCVCVERVG
jgi:hypothetical protein